MAQSPAVESSSDVGQLIELAYSAMSGWELVAVVLALAYLLLVMRQRIECWYAAFISTGIYIFLFWDANLLMESALQIYYLLMAVYGWYQWRGPGQTQANIPIRRWSLAQHSRAVVLVLVLTLLSGYLLQQNSSAAWPYVDSFTTWASVVTTYMVAKKVLENWLYWLLIDAVSMVLYVDRGLYLTALLFGLYLIIVCFGYRQWRRNYRQQLSTSTL